MSRRGRRPAPPTLWRRLRPAFGLLAVVLALGVAAHADRSSAVFDVSGDHQLHAVTTLHAARLGASEALPAPARPTLARHLTKLGRLPAGAVPAALALATLALAASSTWAIRGRRLTETPSRLPPRSPPAAGTSVPGHGADRRPTRPRSWARVVVVPG